MTFYNSQGIPVAYLDNDNEHIYLYNGRPVAYLYDNAVYSFNGQHLGWFENGWMRDLQGNCMFFTEYTNGGGPVRPARCAKPAKCARSAKPAKSARQIRNVKSINSLSWSILSSEEFFQY